MFRKKKLLECIQKYKPSTLLELGCGERPLFKDLSNFKKMYLVEPNIAFYKNALKELRKDETKIEFYLGTLESQIKNLKGKEIDFIVASSLLHEVKNAGRFLGCAHQLCHRKTVLHVSVPNAYSLHRLLAYEMGLIKTVFEKSELQKKFRQRVAFDKQELASILRKNGFKVCDEGSYFIKPFTHAQLQDMLDKGALDTKILDGLYRLGKYLPEYGCEIFINARKK